MRLPAKLGSDCKSGLSAGISLLFSSIGTWRQRQRRRWLTAERSCSGLPSPRPLPRSTFASTAKRAPLKSPAQEPGADDLLKVRRVDLVDDSKKGRIAGSIVVAVFAPGAAQGPQLSLRQFAARTSKLDNAGSHQRGQRRARQDRPLPVRRPCRCAGLGAPQKRPQRFQFQRPQAAGTADLFLRRHQFLRSLLRRSSARARAAVPADTIAWLPMFLIKSRLERRNPA